MFFDQPKRKPIRASVKKAVYDHAKGKCEKCGLTLKRGDPRIAFHHTRSPTVSPTAKTVQMLCRNCHAKYGHSYKTVTHSNLFGSEKEIVIKRKRVKTSKKRKSTKRKATKRKPTSKSSKTKSKPKRKPTRRKRKSA